MMTLVHFDEAMTHLMQFFSVIPAVIGLLHFRCYDFCPH